MVINMKYTEKYLEYDKEKLISAFEAVLFAAGEPVSREKLSEVFEISSSEVELCITELSEKLDGIRSGMEVVKTENNYQLCTRSVLGEFVIKFLEIKRSAPISKPALEALAIIAYRQPVTKGFVEKIRGVDCSGIINSLLERELIEEKGRMDAPGRPILYGTTLNFLKCFGLNSIKELPDLEDPQMTIPDTV